MSNIQVKFRRGTEAEHDTTSGGFTGAEGEVTVDTTNDTLRVHDGSTTGGVRLAKYSELGAGGSTDLAASATGTSLTITSSTGTDATVPAATTSAWGAMTDEDKTKLDGIATGAEVNPTNTDGLTQGSTNLYNQTHSGDATGSTALTLATVNGNVGSFTNANITVNAKGLVTAASSGTVVLSKYSSGWVNTDGTTSVGNGATLDFTHNLGTTNLTVDVYVATNNSGANLVKTDHFVIDLSGNYFGAQVQDVTTSQLTVQLGANGYLDLTTSGGTTGTSFASKYIKVVAIG